MCLSLEILKNIKVKRRGMIANEKTFHHWPNDAKGSHNINHDTVFSNQQTRIVYQATKEPDISNVKWFKRKVQRPDLRKRKTNLNTRQELNDKHFTWDSHKENMQNKAENICLRIPITSNYPDNVVTSKDWNKL